MSWAFRTLLTISAVSFPLFLYVALRISASVGFLRPAAKRPARRVAYLILAWLFSFPLTLLALRVSGGSASLPAVAVLPGWVDILFLYPIWTALIVVVELLGPFLLFDMVALAGIFTPSRLPRLRKILAYARLVLAVIVLAYVPLRAAMDTAHVRETTTEVALGSLPPELENLRITVVGDVQVDRYTGDAKVRQMHDIVRAQSPQILFSGGDIVTDGTGFLSEAERALCGMKGSVVSIGVMGDHDFWSAPNAVRTMHKTCGWEFLENKHTIFTYRGKTILVSGLTHIYSDRLDDAALDEFLADAPKADLRILLVHQPAMKVIHRTAGRGYDLLFAGHTHGGQIVFHPLGIPLTPSMRETRYYSGVHRVGSMQVVVTNGVGLTLAPIRYHAPAEVTSITLVRDPGDR